jgi:hypothetical protein
VIAKLFRSRGKCIKTAAKASTSHFLDPFHCSRRNRCIDKTVSLIVRNNGGFQAPADKGFGGSKN